MVDMEARVKEMLEYCELPDFKGKSFLDVGCADGSWCFMAEKAGAEKVVGVDIDSYWRERFIKKFPAGSEVEHRNVDAEEIGHFEKFDVVFLFAILHHMPKWKALRVIEEACRVGEELYLVVPFDKYEINEEHDRWGPADHQAWHWVPTMKGLEEILSKHLYDITFKPNKVGKRVFIKGKVKKNAIFICGRHCSGKTTLSRLFPGLQYIQLQDGILEKLEKYKQSNQNLVLDGVVKERGFRVNMLEALPYHRKILLWLDLKDDKRREIYDRNQAYYNEEYDVPSLEEGWDAILHTDDVWLDVIK